MCVCACVHFRIYYYDSADGTLGEIDAFAGYAAGAAEVLVWSQITHRGAPLSLWMDRVPVVVSRSAYSVRGYCLRVLCVRAR